MPDERTVSKFTWMTPKERSKLSVGSMTAMVQIAQFYETEKKVSGSNHTFISGYMTYTCLVSRALQSTSDR